MFTRVSQAITRRYSTSLLVVLITTSVGLFLTFSRFDLSPGPAESTCGEPANFLDLRLHYSVPEATAALESYGEAGRANYLLFLPVDTAFALAYCLSLALLLTRMLSTLAGPQSPWLRLNLLPIITLLADILENLCLLWMLTRYPTIGDVIPVLGGYLTSSKHISLILSILILVLGGVTLLVRRLLSSLSSG